MAESPTISIVDADATARARVSRMADEMGVSAAQFTTAEEFLDGRSARFPGCLVTEFRLLGMSGIELQESLAADCISLPIIFVTAHPETAFTVLAMTNGAITVLEKPFSEQELWDALRKALSRDTTVRRIDAKHTAFRRRLAGLTQKERQVLDLMVEGKLNKSIASKLNVSIRTVETRRHRIFEKTGTNSIAELVRGILQTGAAGDQ